jgi:hypothetical protein
MPAARAPVKHYCSYNLSEMHHVINDTRYVLSTGRCIDEPQAAKDLARSIDSIIREFHFGINRLVSRRKLRLSTFSHNVLGVKYVPLTYSV